MATNQLPYDDQEDVVIPDFLLEYNKELQDLTHEPSFTSMAATQRLIALYFNNENDLLSSCTPPSHKVNFGQQLGSYALPIPISPYKRYDNDTLSSTSSGMD